MTELKQQGIDTVFHLGTDADTGALFKDAEAAGWSPAVYLLGTLVGRSITELVPAKMKNQVFLAFPTIPADISAAGAAEYSALLEKNKARCNPCRSSGFRNRCRQDTGPWIGTFRKGPEPRAARDDARGPLRIPDWLNAQNHVWTKPSHRCIGRLHRYDRS